MHTYIHICIHTHTCIHKIHKYTHTHAHTHTHPLMQMSHTPGFLKSLIATLRYFPLGLNDKEPDADNRKPGMEAVYTKAAVALRAGEMCVCIYMSACMYMNMMTITASQAWRLCTCTLKLQIALRPCGICICMHAYIHICYRRGTRLFLHLVRGCII